MNISKISVSRKKVFDECKQRYKYQYHLKTESPEPEPYHFMYGTAIHYIAEVYVLNKGFVPIEDIARDVLEKKTPIDDQGNYLTHLPEEYKTKFPKNVKAIKSLCDKTGFDGYVEYEFNYDLDPPNNRLVLGFIDRLFFKEHKNGEKLAFIIDYKTTKQGMYQLNANNITQDLQLRCYARIVQKEFNIPAKNIFPALYYLNGEKIVGANFSEKDLEKVERELRNGYLEIESSDPEHVVGSVGNHCKRCDFRTLCPFYRNSFMNNQPIKFNWDFGNSNPYDIP